MSYVLHHLVLATQLLQETNRTMHLAQFLKKASLVEEEGLRYCDASEFVMEGAQDVLAKAGGDLLAFGMSFELLEIHTGLKPHYHLYSDSVAIVLDGSPKPTNFEVLLEKPLGIGGWDLWSDSLYRGRVLLLPRHVIHGFHRRVQTSMPLYLLTATFPPPQEGDTYYV